MTLRRGFKNDSDDYSRDVRSEMGLKAYEPLCPWQLAEHLAIPVVPLSEFRDVCLDETLYLTQVEPRCFSAVTVFRGHRRLIVHNDAHTPQRQASNIIHELSHGILRHPPTEPFGEHGCRNFNQEIEEEANWLGPALLISVEAALHIVRKSMSVAQASELYRVTEDVIRMRLNVTGARKRLARQRA